jgi:hypothetical protein
MEIDKKRNVTWDEMMRSADSAACPLSLVDAVDHFNGPSSVFLVAAGLSVLLDCTDKIVDHAHVRYLGSGTSARFDALPPCAVIRQPCR